MKYLWFLMFLIACGGPKLVEIPDATPVEQPDAADAAAEGPRCFEWTADFTASTIPWSPVPVPFQGAKVAKISTNIPDWWDERPPAYLLSVEWDAGGWIRSASLEFPASQIVFASWRDGEWTVDPAINMTPHFREQDDGDGLVMDTRVRAVGVKPAGKPTIKSVVTLLVCEEPLPPEPDAPSLTPIPANETDTDVHIGTPGGCTTC